jgi:hypothetical protein
MLISMTVRSRQHTILKQPDSVRISPTGPRWLWLVSQTAFAVCWKVEAACRICPAWKTYTQLTTTATEVSTGPRFIAFHTSGKVSALNQTITPTLKFNPLPIRQKSHLSFNSHQSPSCYP